MMFPTFDAILIIFHYCHHDDDDYHHHYYYRCHHHYRHYYFHCFSTLVLSPEHLVLQTYPWFPNIACCTFRVYFNSPDRCFICSGNRLCLVIIFAQNNSCLRRFQLQQPRDRGRGGGVCPGESTGLPWHAQDFPARQENLCDNVIVHLSQ